MQAEEAFKRDPVQEVVILNSASASDSMNLQAAGAVHIRMNPVSMTTVLQEIGRTHRIGQFEEPFLLHLFAGA